jgi:(E)-4-hydroxy-3-methylbut-2-enyl-diphosphate synthase
LAKLLEQVESYCTTINKPISIAIMGCNVNGIGECEHANVGIYGNKDKLFIYYHGKQIKTTPINGGFNELKKLINILTTK